MKLKLLAFLIAIMMSVSAFSQIGLYIGDQVWNSTALMRYYNTGLYDKPNKVLRLSTFEYTVDPSDVNTANLYIINQKLQQIATFQAQTGVQVQLTIRCTRTMGTDYDTVPMLDSDQTWWSNFVFSKVNLVRRNFSGWNERSLGWWVDGAGNAYVKNTDGSRNYTADAQTRPERDAACVHKLVALIKTSGLNVFVMAPSVHAINDTTSVGDGLLYTQRFFAALPSQDRPYVRPDAHLYYNYNDSVTFSNILQNEYTDLTRWISYLSSIGYRPANCYVTELGCFYVSSGVSTTTAQAGFKAKAIVKTAVYAGIPATHLFAYSGASGSFQVFNSDGTLTPYGIVIRGLMQP